MISIIIPVFNEESNIRLVIAAVLAAQKQAGKVPLDIIIVNDASTDKTPQIIAQLEKKYRFIRSIHHQINRGIGVGFKEALAVAKYPKFMIVPGDNDAGVGTIKNLFLHAKDADVIFSYYINKEMRGRMRNFLSALYGLIYMLVFDVYIQYINCAAVYSTQLLRKLDIKAQRFSITAEVNIKVLCMGCTYHEVAGYMQTGIGQSKSIRIKNVFEIIKTFIAVMYEIKFAKRDFSNKKPKRIIVDL